MPDHSYPRLTMTYEAMATTFTVTVASADASYVRQAVSAAFSELDRIESRLSRFAQGSDIFRVNRLRAGQETIVHPDTFECLRIALAMWHATDGAFDVAYASAAPPGSESRFSLDDAKHAVRAPADGICLDLGGIGKGFALDRMARLLEEWDVESSLLRASTSTVLAMDAPPGEDGWTAQIGPDRNPRRLALVRAALSGSGKSVQGEHIIDPHTRRPAQGWSRAWSAARTAAVADALSTAFMVLDEERIRKFCRDHADTSAYLQRSDDGELLTISESPKKLPLPLGEGRGEG